MTPRKTRTERASKKPASRQNRPRQAERKARNKAENTRAQAEYESGDPDEIMSAYCATRAAE